MSKNAVPLIGLTEDDTPISAFLPYFYYYEDGGFYYNIDGSISVMYEMEPPNRIMDKHLEDVFNGLVTFLNHYYRDVVFQVFLAVSRGADETHPAVSRYLSVKEKKDMPVVARGCIEQKIEQMKSRKLFEKQDGSAFSAKSVSRVFSITVSPPKPSVKGKLFSTLFGSREEEKEAVREYAEEQVARLNDVARVAMDTLGVVGIRSKKVTPERFLDLFYPVMNAGKRRPVKGFDKLTPLREQLCNSSVDIEDENIVIDGEPYAVVFANAVSGTETNMLFFEDANRNAILDLLGDFLMTMTIYTHNPEKEMMLLLTKRRFSFAMSKKKGGDVDVRANKLRQELDDVITEVGDGKIVLNNAIITFIVRESEADRLINVLGLKGINCYREKDPMLFTMFLESLPFFFRRSHEFLLQRTRKLYPQHVADILPLYPEFRGADHGKTHIYIDRRGNPVVIDLFSDTASAHAVVLGKTGAGKSFFMNDFILQANREECQILVIDKGNSYKRNCLLYGGNYIQLDPNNPTTMNPFYGFDPNDKDNLMFLSSLLTYMSVGINEERDYLTREKRGVLEEAVGRLAEDGGYDSEISLSDFVRYISENYGETGKEIANRIFPFTVNGRYGRFFDGKNRFDITNPFTVFEIGGVNDDELLTAWFMTTAYFYARKIQSREFMGISKYLIMDEVWRLMSMESTIRFFLEIVKTYRKYGASLITVTQDFEDFFANRAGLAIFNNSPIKLLLVNSTNAIRSNAGKLGLTPWELDQYLSLQKTGNYSEIFVKLGDDTSGIIRLIPTQQIYWISTTNDKDKRLLEDYIEKYGGLEAGLEKIVEDMNEYMERFGDMNAALARLREDKEERK